MKVALTFGMTRKLVYRFGFGKAEGRAEWKELLGGKGANLAEMANMGIPVPPGFTITTEASVDYLASSTIPEGLFETVRESMQWLERGTGKRFGGAENPLLVSVRSGARSSMPGMMDTVLNLGLNDQTVLALARQSQSERFAFDAYRRLLCMFADVVLGVERPLFDAPLDEARRRVARERGLSVPDDVEALTRLIPDPALGAAELRQVVADYKRIIREHSTQEFPSDPHSQLEAAVAAVFRSWNNPRAKLYRSMHDQGLISGTELKALAEFAVSTSADFELPRELRRCREGSRDGIVGQARSGSVRLERLGGNGVA